MNVDLTTITARKTQLKKQAGLKDFIRDFGNHELDTLTIDQLLEVATVIEKIKKETSVVPPGSD